MPCTAPSASATPFAHSARRYAHNRAHSARLSRSIRGLSEVYQNSIRGLSVYQRSIADLSEFYQRSITGLSVYQRSIRGLSEVYQRSIRGLSRARWCTDTEHTQRSCSCSALCLLCRAMALMMSSMPPCAAILTCWHGRACRHGAVLSSACHGHRRSGRANTQRLSE